MRQRLRELGGTLEIQSGEAGTTVTAVLPESSVELARA
jgi:signal transduction histidine kinase